ncbi:linalool dehydratase/isomerase [Colletotrichum liriopes]|uniref:Linalool dehydratase/isomerase n=1 Tax=Colletotrichum liriopes TaxID=708192 RepID=A0AA37H056_9PEZI|nr:linalool dehydratase/isomerase [Colletotrichum liriopes]
MAGVATDPDLKELRKPWADPIVKENIMYSGHLLMMVSLYAMLFDDDEFEKPDSLEFVWDPVFFGMGPEKFSYSAQTLQDTILKEMENNGWVGVCCEPNCVFVVCNQFPLIGVRLRDARQGTTVIEGVLEKYKAAWDKKGLVGSDGLFPDLWMVKQDFTLPAKDPAWTAWGCAFMNAWNSTFVRSHFDEQSLGFVTNTEGEVRLNQPSVGAEFRKLVKSHGASPTSRKTLEEARQNAKDAMQLESAKENNFPYAKPMFGYIVQWLSELGKDVESKGLFEYADKHLKPTWERGGLYYPRNDKRFDDNLDWTHMDPFSGNAAIGYGRLNVEDGQKIMWEQPWTADILACRPFFDEITLGDGVDFLRGDWDHVNKLLVLTVRTWNQDTKLIKPVIKNLEPGLWNVFIGEELKVSRVLSAGENVALEVQVGDSDLDIVAVKQI